MKNIRLSTPTQVFGPFDSWDSVVRTIRWLRSIGENNISLHRTQHVCDFCADPTPLWEFDADDTLLAHIGGEDHMSGGAWAACGTCHDLILDDDREGLLERAYRKWEAYHGGLGVPKSLVITMLDSVHSAFRIAWRRDIEPSRVPTDEELLRRAALDDGDGG